MASSFLLLKYFAICLLNIAMVTSNSPFLTNTPGRKWRQVGYLDMTDPTQQCPDSWQKFTSPRSSCGKKSTAPCDSLNVPTSGASYQKVCGRFRGYQVGSTDAFGDKTQLDIETAYMDGVSITYGSPGSRHHVYTYAAGVYEQTGSNSCPCTKQGTISLLNSDFYCESGNPGPDWSTTAWYSSDVLWDGLQCGGNESMCCNATDLPWFCRTFATPISDDLEVRICTDELLNTENVAIESYELYIQAIIPSMNIQVTPVLNPNNTLHHLEISWIPVETNLATYTVRVVGSDNSVGQGYTVCTSSPCLYVHQVTQEANNYTIFVTPINRDGTLGSQDSTAIYGPSNTIFHNVSFLSYNNSIVCSFLNNQSLYCMVCCSTDPSVPPDSSVYNISSTRSTEVTVSLQGLTSGQMHYCKAAATSTNSPYCTGPVVGDVKMYFSFVTSLLPITSPTTSSMSTLVTAIDTYAVIGITIGTAFVVFFSLGVMVASCICCVVKMRSKVTLHHSPMAPSVYEMTGTDQKVAAFEVETNSAYGIAAQQSEPIYI